LITDKIDSKKEELLKTAVTKLAEGMLTTLVCFYLAQNVRNLQ